MPIVLFVLLLSLSLTASPIKSITCLSEVSNTLINLNVVSPWMRFHESPNFSILESKVSGEQKFSVWLATTDIETTLVVNKGGVLIQHSFQKANNCKMVTMVSKGEASTLFTTLDFYRGAKDHSKFVILLWSSQMAISLKQVQDLKDKKFDVPIVFVLDEHASLEQAKEFIKKEKLPESYLRRWNFVGRLPASIEHYPSALFVKNGKIMKYIPGYSQPEVLENLIKENL